MTVAMQAAVNLEIRSATEREFSLASWKQLEQRVGDRGVACSADWTAAWLDAYGDLVPHHFVLARAGEQLVAACLLCEGVEQKDGPLNVKSLHIGTAGEPESISACVEYNRLLVDPAFETEFVAKLVEHLNGLTDFDQWNLDGFDASALQAFAACEEKLDRETSAARYFDFKAAREKGDLLAALGHEPRRKAKKGLKHYEGIRLEWAESLDAAAEFFGDLTRLHQARWESLGKPGCYASDRFVKFQEGLIARLIPTGRMVLSRVSTPCGVVGCNQIFFEHNRALVYQCGWSPAPQGISPGVVVDYLNMEESLRRGLDAYDFMGHETQHKKDLSNACNEIVWAKRRAPRLKFVVLEQARRLKRWLG